VLGVPRRDPPVEHDAARAGDRESVAVPRWLRRVSGQRTVQAVVLDEVLKLDEQGYDSHATISIRGPYASSDGSGGSIPPLRFEFAAPCVGGTTPTPGGTTKAPRWPGSASR
jgi:hypothetical protein